MRTNGLPSILCVSTSDIDLLAKQFTDAAHEERKYDKKTGKPYRVYHAIPVTVRGVSVPGPHSYGGMTVKAARR